MQKFPAPTFTVTAALDGSRLRDGERAGLVVLGADYAHLGLVRAAGRLRVVRASCREQDAATGEVFAEGPSLAGTRVCVRVLVTEGARCEFGASIDGGPFATVGAPFQARADRWVGARVGLFALAPAGRGETGSVDVEAFRVE
jgi:hypothetical protein